MKGDFSRNTFDKKKHFTSVRMQQGRVQLDADWNEQMDIIDNRIRVGSEDFIGGSGAPSSDPGYKITLTATKSDLTIGKGRFYVQGILIENNDNINYSEQILPDNTISDGLYLAYLDVWQQGVSAAIDPSIEEPALNGADTTMRVKNVAQVKLLALPNNKFTGDTLDCKTVIDNDVANKAKWDGLVNLEQKNVGKLNVTVDPNANLSNQLYRVEIHKSGNKSTAEFKWSRNNGALVGTIKAIDKNNVVTINASQNSALNFKADQWIELSTQKKELQDKSGIFVKISKVDGNNLTLSRNLSSTEQTDLKIQGIVRQWDIDNKLLQDKIKQQFFPVTVKRNKSGSKTVINITLTASNKPTNLRVGLFVELKKSNTDSKSVVAQITSIANNVVTVNDLTSVTDSEITALTLIHALISPVTPVSEDGFITLENGLKIKFEEGNYKIGDYWLIPSRAINNNIEWPKKDGKFVAQLPEGIQHYYAKLALARRSTTGSVSTWKVVGDCRNIISALGNKAYQSDPKAPSSSVFVDKNGKVDVTKSVNILNETLTNKWSTTTPKLIKRERVTASIVDEKIYIIGGSSGTNALNIVEEYDPTKNTVVSKKSMTTARYSASSSVVNGKIYVIGGNDGTKALNIVEEYDPIKDSWTKKTPMSTARTILATSVVNGKIYAIAGINNGVRLTTVEEFDPAGNSGKGSWITKNPILTKRDAPTASAYNNKIYVIGGYDGSKFLNTVEEYDPAASAGKGKSTFVASMSAARSSLSSNVVNGKIYAIAGWNNKHLNVIEEYNPTINTWITRTSLPDARSSQASNVFDGKIYVIDGFVNSVAIYTPHQDALQVTGNVSISKKLTINKTLNDQFFSLLFGKNIIKITNQREFEATFGNGSKKEVVIPANQTIILNPIQGTVTGDLTQGAWGGKGNKPENTYNGRPAYILKNQVRLSSNVSILGFNEDDTIVVKSHKDIVINNVTTKAADIKFIVGSLLSLLGTTPTSITGVKLSGWTFDGRGAVIENPIYDIFFIKNPVITSKSVSAPIIPPNPDSTPVTTLNQSLADLATGKNKITAIPFNNTNRIRFYYLIFDPSIRVELYKVNPNSSQLIPVSASGRIIFFVPPFSTDLTALISQAKILFQNANLLTSNSPVDIFDLTAKPSKDIDTSRLALKTNTMKILPTLGGSLTSTKNGGAFVLTNCRDIELNCKIINCKTAGNGGAIFSSDTSTSYITAENIYNCSASEGGGIYQCYYSTITAYYCQATVTGGSLGGGGANLCHFSKITTHNCKATVGDGGGCYDCDSSTIMARNCYAHNDGGGAFNCDYSTITVYDCHARWGGGVFGCHRSTIIAYSCKAIQYNGGAAYSCSHGVITAESCTSLSNGGGAYNCNSATIRVVNCKSSAGNGGGVYDCDYSTITAINCSAPKGNGGGAYACNSSVAVGAWSGNTAKSEKNTSNGTLSTVSNIAN